VSVAIALFAACGGKEVSVTVENPFKTFRDVPGITLEEIAAIEKLQREHGSFNFGASQSTEAFVTENGEIGGFTALLCEYLSDLFGIPFQPREYQWNDLIAGLTRGNIDFMGNLTATEERLRIYKMTDPIVEHQLKMMRIRGSYSLERIALERLPRYVFIETSNIRNIVASVTSPGTYETVLVESIDHAYEALLGGRADAYISGDDTVDYFLADNVYTESFFPLTFTPASMATANPDLAPVISVVDKALNNGAKRYINHLNNLGFEDFKKERFLSQLNDEERAFLRNPSPARLASRYYNYPVGFYNIYEHEWQGIAFDVLAEVSKFSGLRFQVANNETAELPELVKMLDTGEAHLMPDITYSESLKGRAIWTRNNFLTNQYALLSKTDFPNISLNEIANARIGLIATTMPAQMFSAWFPGATNTKEYATDSGAFSALDNGEIDLLMATKNRLLSIINYYELPNYKANYLFNNYEASFAFNKNQAVLRSIIDKALPLIDTNTITEQWMTKTYDYRSKVAEGRLPLFIGAIVLSAMVIALILFILYRSRDEGKRLAYQVTIKTKQATQASEAKSRFIANMSHEMRTPMNSIIGFSELAINDKVPPETKDYLDKILINSELLLQLINDVLDISKIETGGMELENAPFDLHELLTSSHTMIIPRAQEKGVNLYFYAEPSIGRKLIGDSLRLRQVLVNLLSNAVKFTGKNGMVKVSAIINEETAGEPLKDDAVTIRFEIKDSGLGISPEQIEQILQPFTQVDMATTRKFGGTGLGLAISKNIIEKMGGKFMVESMLGVGSKFSFEVTFDTVETAREESADKTPAETDNSQFKGEVLLCEDNDMNQQVLCEHLKRVGIKADVAENGREGFNMVRRRHEKGDKPYDLIFMDIHMPVMDGLEASKLIMELDTGVPIVAMTANVMAHDKELYKKIGMKDCLGKPFRVQELYSYLAKYLTPGKWNVETQIEDNQFVDKLKLKLMVNFVKDNKARYSEITNALNSGDIKLAHRLTHTLKSNAALLGKTKLQETCEDAERLLEDGKNKMTSEILDVLETRLTAVLNELEPLTKDVPPPPVAELLGEEETREVLTKIKPLLEAGNADCLKYINTLRGIPGTEKLIQQMEDLDFGQAFETLMSDIYHLAK
jgi:signal transduction histidine kinase/DNA-binding response OmpR family regulator